MPYFSSARFFFFRNLLSTCRYGLFVSLLLVHLSLVLLLTIMSFLSFVFPYLQCISLGGRIGTDLGCAGCRRVERTVYQCEFHECSSLTPHIVNYHLTPLLQSVLSPCRTFVTYLSRIEIISTDTGFAACVSSNIIPFCLTVDIQHPDNPEWSTG